MHDNKPRIKFKEIELNSWFERNSTLFKKIRAFKGFVGYDPTTGDKIGFSENTPVSVNEICLKRNNASKNQKRNCNKIL